MSIRKPVWMLFLALDLIACAKKMAPPSPDRFRPHLQEVSTKTKSQLELVFDEDVDPYRLFVDSFEVVGSDSLPLVVRGISRGRQPGRVLLWTQVQQPQIYRLQGPVWDMAGNRAYVRARFRASERSDTIAPRVVGVLPAPGSARFRGKASFKVRFSEPLDTAAASGWLIVPKFDSAFIRAWDPDWQSINFALRETLPQGSVVYLLLQPGLGDLEGNRTRDPAFTYATPDSIIEVDPVKGTAVWRNGPLGTGTVFFNAETTLGLATILRDGTFTTRVKRGLYQVVAVADTDLDGKADLQSRADEFSTVTETLALLFSPETLPLPIDAYRR